MSHTQQPASGLSPRSPGVFLRRVHVENFKSIGKCELMFRPLTILVGRNGSGKSNFLEALRFVVDSLENSLDYAFKGRGGIEEPETALHPAAAAALMNALREATRRTQIIVTSHSPDLIDQIDMSTDNLIAVQNTRGNTEIGIVDAASLEAIRTHLYSPGDLLRMDQLEIDRAELTRQKQLEFFDSPHARS